MVDHSYRDQPCDLCGEGSRAWVEIKIAFGDGLLEYSQTRLCREHWNEYGVAAAIEHNQEVANG